jgi:hypothetical protein
VKGRPCPTGMHKSKCPGCGECQCWCACAQEAVTWGDNKAARHLPEPLAQSGAGVMGELVIWRCPECGEQMGPHDFGTPTESKAQWGHYHSFLADWPHDEDPWVDAERIPVVEASKVEGLVAALGAALLLLDPSDGRYVSEDWLAFKALWNDKFLPAIEHAGSIGFDVPQLQPAVERPEASTIPAGDLAVLMRALQDLAPLLRRSLNFAPIMEAEQALLQKHPCLATFQGGAESK